MNLLKKTWKMLNGVLVRSVGPIMATLKGSEDETAPIPTGRFDLSSTFRLNSLEKKGMVFPFWEGVGKMRSGVVFFFIFFIERGVVKFFFPSFYYYKEGLQLAENEGR